MKPRHARELAVALALAVSSASWAADAPTLSLDPASRPATTTAPAESSFQPELTLDPTVTAEKRPTELAKTPGSISVVSRQTIENADIRTVRDAAFYAPSVVISEFTNRRLSFPFVRGVGSGRNSPAVTTYIDGVPQLSFATSNQELHDIRQIEFLRGPQGTLYGRNTIGGVISITTNEPTNDLEFFGRTSVGNFSYNDTYAGANLPIVKDRVSLRFSGGYMSRDGYSKNLVTGNDLDDKEAEYGRLALKVIAADNLTLTLRINGEHDADGDYALGDLASLRRNPWRVARDFEGDSNRDLGTFSLTVDYGITQNLKLTSITALQGWASRDATDLDTLPVDLIKRYNRERQRELTQEFRLSSAPLKLAENVSFSWVAGLFVFADDYKQRAINSFSDAGAALVGAPFAFRSMENGDLCDSGVGLFGQGTLSIQKFDLTLGARGDYEHREADLSTGSTLAGLTPSADTRDFSAASFRAALAYRWDKDAGDNHMSYISAAQGYKAGGFNTSAPAGQMAFGKERSWTYELGHKAQFLDKRLALNADLFYIDWNDLQLDVPTGAPGVFFIDNVGKAYSWGGEMELTYFPVNELELFTGLGLDHAKFSEYQPAPGVSYAGHQLPFAPHVTWNAGAQYTLKLDGDWRMWVRGEYQLISEYAYDASSAATQDLYDTVNFRLGIGHKNVRLEGWVRNALDTHYVPLALPLQFAPSGYVGESGAPRTFGVTLSVEF